MPQPRPVWFVWENGALIVYSRPDAMKIAHIARSQNVALHFNTDAGGEDVQVILGKAQVDASLPPCKLNKAYCQKYRDGILALGMTEEQYSAMFSTAIRVTPLRLRGLEPLPQVGDGGDDKVSPDR
jgi:PPOX class probable F420-dependent enzyme